MGLHIILRNIASYNMENEIIGRNWVLTSAASVLFYVNIGQHNMAWNMEGYIEK